LIAADEFAALYNGPCTIEIALPNDPSAGQYNLNGQTISLGTVVTATVKEIKEQLSLQYLNALAANKIQLKHTTHGFLKDSSSLASLNLGPGTQLELSLKSRGGKR
jgi:hypothetical protein